MMTEQEMRAELVALYKEHSHCQSEMLRMANEHNARLEQMSAAMARAIRVSDKTGDLLSDLWNHVKPMLPADNEFAVRLQNLQAEYLEVAATLAAEFGSDLSGVPDRRPSDADDLAP